MKIPLKMANKLVIHDKEFDRDDGVYRRKLGFQTKAKTMNRDNYIRQR